MAIDFPNSPSVGDLYTVGNRSWRWDGSVWRGYTAPSLYRQDAPPSAPQTGDQWFETDTGRLFVYYDSSWIELGNATDIAGALQPKQITDLTAVTSLTTDDVFAVVDNPSSAVAANKITLENLAPALMQSAPQTTFRNFAMNGDFRINQRGVTSLTSSNYMFDRYCFDRSSSTSTMTSESFVPGSPILAGYESEKYMRISCSGQSAYSGISAFYHPIEDVRTLAGATVTISFWARCQPAGGQSSTPQIAIAWWQFFGYSGSTRVDTHITKVTLSTTWTRYSVTTTVPSISGKSIPVAAESCLALEIYCAAGSFFDARTGTLGIQNNTFDFWGIQVERGSYATPFERRPINTELAMCQRYYYSSGTVWSGFIANNSNQFAEAFVFKHPVSMRSTPTLTSSFTSNDNAVQLTTTATSEGVYMRETCSNTGFPYSSFTYSYRVEIDF